MAARFSFVKYDFIYPDVSPGYIIIPMYAIYHWLNWANSDEDIGTWHGSFDAQNDRHDAAVWALLGAFQKYTQFLVGISGSIFGGDRETGIYKSHMHWPQNDRSFKTGDCKKHVFKPREVLPMNIFKYQPGSWV